MDQNETINSINSDLIRGHIDTIILKALQAGDRYGYDIIKEIEHKSEGQYVIKQPTLYSCLKRLEVQGFVKSYWGSKSIGGRKKYFTLTDLGRELFIRNINDWNYSRDVINKLISDDNYDAQDEETTLQDEIEPSNQENSEEVQTACEQLEAEPEEMEEQDDSEAVDQEIEPEIIEEVAEIEEAESELVDEDEHLDEDEIDDEDEFEEDDQSDDEDDFDEFEDEDDEDELDEFEEDDDDQDDEELEESEDDENCQLDDEDENDEIVEFNLEDDDDGYEGELVEIEDFEQESSEPEVIDQITEQPNDESIVDPVQSPTDQDQCYEQATEETDEVDPCDLPLSVAEQNHAFEDYGSTDEESSEIVYKFYDEQKQESYLTNADNADYTSARNDFIDYNNYFKDDQYDYLDEEESASTLDATETDTNIELNIPEESQEPTPTPSDSVTHRFEAYRRFVREPEEPKTVFYSYNNSVPNDNSSVIDSEYRSVIAKLIADNIVISQPQNDDQTKAAEYFNVESDPQQTVQEAEAQAISEQIASDTGDKISLRTHNLNAIKAYNKKHYYYSNQLRLFQFGLLFAIMLVEIALSFYFIEVRHNGLNVAKITLALYIAAVVLAALFPIVSFFMASSNYYKRKRINYSGKSSALFSIAVTILLILVIFFVNVYGGILIGNINNYLSSLIMPIVLSTNVIVNAIIFHCLYKSGKYNIED